MVPLPCGNVSVFCPAGSSAPTAVSVGYYTGGGSNASTFFMQTPCPQGSYCVNGTQLSCPGGYFRNSVRGSALSACAVVVLVCTEPALHPRPRCMSSCVRALQVTTRHALLGSCAQRAV